MDAVGHVHSRINLTAGLGTGWVKGWMERWMRARRVEYQKAIRVRTEKKRAGTEEGKEEEEEPEATAAESERSEIMGTPGKKNLGSL